MKDTPAPEVKVGLIAVDDLEPYARNARVHSDDGVARLVKIIESVGWTNPILMDGEGIVAGHKRRLAALAIYAGGGTIRLPGGEVLPEGMVPYIDVSGWSDEQRRAYILADNQTTLDSEWDMQALAEELSGLSADGVDLDLTGIEPSAIQEALKNLPDRGGFLSDLSVKPEDEESKDGRGVVSSSTINLTFAVTPSERDKIIDWLTGERKARGLATTAAALAALAAEN